MPRSIRDDPAETAQFSALHQGVPSHLRKPLTHWVFEFFANPSQVGTEDHNRKLRDLIEGMLHREVSTYEDLRLWYIKFGEQLASDQELLLDVIDVLLSREASEDDAGVLEELLQQAGSAWRVERLQEGSWRLGRRVDSATERSLAVATATSDSASSHLKAAWHATYGRNRAPSEGYARSVKAVEAALRPVVSPNDSLATLGKMIGQLRSQPELYVTTLGPARGSDAVGEFRGQLNLLWTGQSDRHGTDDHNVPSTVTQVEAEQAVLLATHLVASLRQDGLRRQS